jgi:hypothetical protein
MSLRRSLRRLRQSSFFVCHPECSRGVWPQNYIGSHFFKKPCAIQNRHPDRSAGICLNIRPKGLHNFAICFLIFYVIRSASLLPKVHYHIISYSFPNAGPKSRRDSGVDLKLFVLCFLSPITNAGYKSFEGSNKPLFS